jgi:hypothetical protein
MAVKETLSSVTREVTYGPTTRVEDGLTATAVLIASVMPLGIDNVAARIVRVSHSGLERVLDLPEENLVNQLF